LNLSHRIVPLYEIKYSTQNISVMKNIVLKSLVFLPLLFFIDYLIMMIIGCTSCLFGFTDNFYNCTYCYIGKSLIAISLVFFAAIITPEIKSLIKKLKVSL